MTRRTLMQGALSLAAIIGLLLCVLALTPRLATASAPQQAPTAPSQFTTQAQMGFAAGDDWEPSLSTDRNKHVYLLYKHYDVAGQTTCSSCDQHLLLQVSSDNGKTWSAPRPIDPEATKGGQFDPQIVVDPVDGSTVWASFLQNGKSSIAVMKSTDFRQTWSGPTIVENLQRATDKDELAVHGQTIAVAFNAVQKIYAAISHDGGATWTTSLISEWQQSTWLVARRRRRHRLAWRHLLWLCGLYAEWRREGASQSVCRGLVRWRRDLEPDAGGRQRRALSLRELRFRLPRRAVNSGGGRR